MTQSIQAPDMDRTSLENMIASVKRTHDSLSAARSYGDPIELDGVTMIPVARVTGGAGGGGGEGEGEEGSGGGGFGTGFGVNVNPIGVYAVSGDHVEWKPSIDVTRLARGGQVLAGIVSVCVTLVMIIRPRR